MSLTRIATASLFAVALGGFALHVGCSSEEDPECASDASCRSATTACTRGVCRGGKCAAEAVADGTHVADQTPVIDKYCVRLECRGGVAIEAPESSKTAPPVECQTQTCENMTPKSEPLNDGVPCRSSMGACRGGACLLSDSGPIGTPDTSTSEVGDGAVSDSESDSEADATAD